MAQVRSYEWQRICPCLLIANIRLCSVASDKRARISSTCFSVFCQSLSETIPCSILPESSWASSLVTATYSLSKSVEVSGAYSTAAHGAYLLFDLDFAFDGLFVDRGEAGVIFENLFWSLHLTCSGFNPFMSSAFSGSMMAWVLLFFYWRSITGADSASSRDQNKDDMSSSRWKRDVPAFSML